MGWPVATAVRVGGDGYARRLWVRETEEGDERGRVRGVPGACVAALGMSRATRGQPGRQLPVWHAAAPWLSSPLPSGERRKTTGRGGGLLGCTVTAG